MLRPRYPLDGCQTLAAGGHRWRGPKSYDPRRIERLFPAYPLLLPSAYPEDGPYAYQAGRVLSVD